MGSHAPRDLRAVAGKLEGSYTMDRKSLRPKTINLRDVTTEELVALTASGVSVVHGMSDMTQLRQAYSDADAAALVANSKLRVVKPD